MSLHFVRTSIQLAVLGVVLVYVTDVIWSLDLNKRVYNHRPGKCVSIEGPVHGGEHTEFIPSLNVALISSGLQYMEDFTGAKGQIFLYDFDDERHLDKAVPVNIINEPFDFHPHGMSHFSENGKIYVHAISHTSPKNNFQHSIETRELVHLKSVRHAALLRPNSIFALGRDQFFVTNDGAAQTALSNMIEIVLKRRTGNIVYFDGTEYTTVVDGELTPNGIWVDAKEHILFYTSPVGEFFKVLQLSADLKTVTKELASINLLTSPDNLFRDAEGAFWTGAHPVLYKLTDMALCARRRQPAAEPFTPSRMPPSQVLRIKFSPDFKSHQISEPYTDDGNQISCSSSAVIDGKGNMLISSIGQNVVRCKYTAETIEVQ